MTYIKLLTRMHLAAPGTKHVDVARAWMHVRHTLEAYQEGHANA